MVVDTVSRRKCSCVATLLARISVQSSPGGVGLSREVYIEQSTGMKGARTVALVLPPGDTPQVKKPSRHDPGVPENKFNEPSQGSFGDGWAPTFNTGHRPKSQPSSSPSNSSPLLSGSSDRLLSLCNAHTS